MNDVIIFNIIELIYVFQVTNYFRMRIFIYFIHIYSQYNTNRIINCIIVNFSNAYNLKNLLNELNENLVKS